MWQRVKEKAEYYSLSISLVSVLVGGVFFIGALFFLMSAKNETESEDLLEETTESYLMDTVDAGELEDGESEEELSETEQNSYVDVKGAVHNPGVYKVASDMRLIDAVELAGGFLISADQSQINLALKLADQMVVYVPQIGEEIKEVSESNILVESETEKEEGKININTADASQLQTLNGIGEKKADKIIQYREENGSFQSIEDLKNVSGIGEKTFEALRDFVVVGSQ